ncbi:conjugal transfer protein TraB [Natrarchaeobius chitinivorans]|uniref:Conjugal transfer protein TraB n=1 Tax=Natrarchaeobius chitinivorans TaxID=1679083 RepID=A0A3N6LWS3_NATCH|nr:conjugal transfer protein TraB [Natrarchaeobius chitinivorans]
MSANGSITIVPSVHFSVSHCRRVRSAIRDEDPDLVAVELGASRYEYVDRDADPVVFDLARAVAPAPAAAYAAVRALQRTVVRLYGFDLETTDMGVAIETAAELDANVALVDDPIEETFSGIVGGVSLTTLPRILRRLMRSRRAERIEPSNATLLAPGEIESGEDVRPMIDRLRRLVPNVAEVLIDRRDRAMAERLHALRLEGYDVVAVVGVAHHDGIRRRLEGLESRADVRDVTVPIRSPSGSPERILVD